MSEPGRYQIYTFKRHFYKLCQIQPSASWPLRSCQFGNAGPLLPSFSCLWPRFWNRKIVGLHHLLRMKMTAIWFPSAIKQLHAVLREILPCCCILLRATHRVVWYLNFKVAPS
ncbi:unnamed protein product [Citrullus colocynthis]|uniref:Uncharacterized protein n=1 Tax=Citrullus colocynthis TaxID=252529 RepID=A0ABP0XZN9_9ROSI